MYIHTYIHTYIHICARIYIYICTHTCSMGNSKPYFRAIPQLARSSTAPAEWFEWSPALSPQAASQHQGLRCRPAQGALGSYFAPFWGWFWGAPHRLAQDSCLVVTVGPHLLRILRSHIHNIAMVLYTSHRPQHDIGNCFSLHVICPYHP